MGAYSCISSVRAWIRVENIKGFFKMLSILKAIYNKHSIRKCFKLYNAKIAGGNRFAAFFLKYKFYNTAALILFFASKRRYG